MKFTRVSDALHFHSHGQFIQLYRDASRLIEGIRQCDAQGQRLCSDVIAERLDGSCQRFMPLDHHADTVGHFETALLTEILDPVDQLPGDTFATQLLRHGNVERDGQLALRSDQPPRACLPTRYRNRLQ